MKLKKHSFHQKLTPSENKIGVLEARFRKISFLMLWHCVICVSWGTSAPGKLEAYTAIAFSRKSGNSVIWLQKRHNSLFLLACKKKITECIWSPLQKTPIPVVISFFPWMPRWYWEADVITQSHQLTTRMWEENIQGDFFKYNILSCLQLLPSIATSTQTHLLFLVVRPKVTQHYFLISTRARPLGTSIIIDICDRYFPADTHWYPLRFSSSSWSWWILQCWAEWQACLESLLLSPSILPRPLADWWKRTGMQGKSGWNEFLNNLLPSPIYRSCTFVYWGCYAQATPRRDISGPHTPSCSQCEL